MLILRPVDAHTPTHGGVPIPVLPRLTPSLRPAFPAPRLAPLLLAAWCGFLFFYGLDAGPLYRTEALRAVIAQECLRGYWVVPTLYGEPFLTKPPGQYVAIAACSLPVGRVTEVTARLPSAFAAAGTVFLVWRLFRRAVGEREAMVAAVVAPVSVLWLDKAPSAEIDMFLVFWVTAALVLLFEAVEGRGTPSVGLIPLSFLCLALGTLTKWTAPAFFALAAGPYLLLAGRWRVLVGWRIWLGVGVWAAVVGGWAVAAANEAGWETLRDTVVREGAQRFDPNQKRRGYPWAEVAAYPWLVLAAHLPFAAFVPLTFRRGRLAGLAPPARRLVLFLHCWVWPSLLFWTVVPQHNVRYSLPVSPGLMGLGAVGFLMWRRNPSPTLPRSREGLQTSVTPFLPREGGRGVRFFFPVILVVWIVAKVAFVEAVWPQRSAKRNAAPAATALREHVPPGETLHVLRLKDEGVMFYYGRPARRARTPEELPRPAYAALIGPEWDERHRLGDFDLIQWLSDQQGDPIILVKVK